MNDSRRSSLWIRSVTCVGIGSALWLGALGDAAAPAQEGPPSPRENPNRHETGDRGDGKAVFRMETFGNDGFWTDAARLPAGMCDLGLGALHSPGGQ